MQIRSIVTASLFHGAAVLGVGIGLHTWVAAEEPPAQVAILPSPPEMTWPEADAVDFEPEEALPEMPDAEFVDPEILPPPAPAPDPDAEKPAEEILEPFPPTSPLRGSRDLLVQVRPRPVVEEPPVLEPTPVAQPAPTSFVEAVADDRNEPPEYPARARRRNLEGDVVLLVTVGVDGAVTKVDIFRSAGLTSAHKSLDTAAIAAICKWHYAPAMRGGKPVEVVIRVPIEFRLRAR